MRRACTINEPNIVALHGLPDGASSRRARPTRSCVARSASIFCDAHRKAVDAIRTGRAGRARRPHAVDDRLPGGRRRRAEARPDLRSMEDVFLDATEGDDFVGVQTYTPERVGPDRLVGNEDGVPVLPMGYEYWPRGARGDHPPGVELHRG